MLGGPHSGCGHCEENKNTLPCWESNCDPSVVQLIPCCGIINNILGLMDPRIVFKDMLYLCINM
jgi:hypothetical protein